MVKGQQLGRCQTAPEVVEVVRRLLNGKERRWW
jgi:hypothetical protein